MGLELAKALIGSGNDVIITSRSRRTGSRAGRGRAGGHRRLVVDCSLPPPSLLSRRTSPSPR
ncbi:hypothetical protein MRBLWH10_002716 [Microbacterium sp. LWH10-1.2]|uniref:hypothetical protein n=1 Tax=Microbacterium sp. LWH11-1.2 TaxID=3135258 RepID=UPI003244EF59